MQPSQPTEKELLKTILVPLLEDFKYWFSRSHSLLESEKMPFLSENEQNQLLAKLKQAQEEVETAKMLFHATNGQGGVDTKVLLLWHQLVAQCWDVARKWRESKQNNN